MIYLLIVGILLFFIATAVTIYCRFVYSAMEDDVDIQIYNKQVNSHL